MKGTDIEASLRGIGAAAMDLLEAELALLERASASMPAVVPAPGEGCCRIPEPCWMPEDLGAVESRVCPGGRAVLRLAIENCDGRGRRFVVTATGAAAGRVSLAPTGLALGPKERGVVTATLGVPAEAPECAEHEALVWVIGCNRHFVHWRVRVEARGASTCHELGVSDCPDYVHHWYDHFYCRRPCFGEGKGVSRG